MSVIYPCLVGRLKHNSPSPCTQTIFRLKLVPRTNTPQEYFAHVGSLESQGAIALIAGHMLNHEQCGLKQACLDVEEEKLLQTFEKLLSDYEGTRREQWAGLKENCLLLLGSHIASCIDHLISGLRTPAIIKSAIYSQ
jgi:hypothetical protein